jgi:hypothetical protein
MVVTPKGLMLSKREFEALLDYSCSLPTGTTIGKRWKRSDVYSREKMAIARQERRALELWELNWWMGEYIPDKDPTMIGIEWTPILLPPSLQSANAQTSQSETEAEKSTNK